MRFPTVGQKTQASSLLTDMTGRVPPSCSRAVTVSYAVSHIMYVAILPLFTNNLKEEQHTTSVPCWRRTCILDHCRA